MSYQDVQQYIEATPEYPIGGRTVVPLSKDTPVSVIAHLEQAYGVARLSDLTRPMQPQGDALEVLGAGVSVPPPALAPQPAPSSQNVDASEQDEAIAQAQAHQEHLQQQQQPRSVRPFAAPGAPAAPIEPVFVKGDADDKNYVDVMALLNRLHRLEQENAKLGQLLEERKPKPKSDSERFNDRLRQVEALVAGEQDDGAGAADPGNLEVHASSLHPKGDGDVDKADGGPNVKDPSSWPRPKAPTVYVTGAEAAALPRRTLEDALLPVDFDLRWKVEHGPRPAQSRQWLLRLVREIFDAKAEIDDALNTLKAPEGAPPGLIAVLGRVGCFADFVREYVLTRFKDAGNETLVDLIATVQRYSGEDDEIRLFDDFVCAPETVGHPSEFFISTRGALHRAAKNRQPKWVRNEDPDLYPLPAMHDFATRILRAWQCTPEEVNTFSERIQGQAFTIQEGGSRRAAALKNMPAPQSGQTSEAGTPRRMSVSTIHIPITDPEKQLNQEYVQIRHKLEELSQGPAQASRVLSSRRLMMMLMEAYTEMDLASRLLVL